MRSILLFLCITTSLTVLSQSICDTSVFEGKATYYNLIEKGLIERKMAKNVQTIIVLNEKEACVLFPKNDGESDLTEMFYSDDPMFHEWCLDYFRFCWYGSDEFIESKLKE